MELLAFQRSIVVTTGRILQVLGISADSIRAKSAVLAELVKNAQHKTQSEQLKSAKKKLVHKRLIEPSWTLQARGTLYIWRLYG